MNKTCKCNIRLCKSTLERNWFKNYLVLMKGSGKQKVFSLSLPEHGVTPGLCEVVPDMWSKNLKAAASMFSFISEDRKQTCTGRPKGSIHSRSDM